MIGECPPEIQDFEFVSDVLFWNLKEIKLYKNVVIQKLNLHVNKSCKQIIWKPYKVMSCFSESKLKLVMISGSYCIFSKMFLVAFVQLHNGLTRYHSTVSVM